MRNLLRRSFSGIIYVLIFISAILFSKESYTILISFFGMIIKFVRKVFLNPFGGPSLVYDAKSYRAAGLSNEPASYAFFLILVAIPILLMGLIEKTHRKRTFILFAVTAVIAFLWSFSTTGWFVLFCMLLAGVVLGPYRKKIIVFGTVGFTLLVLLLFWIFPANYMSKIYNMWERGDAIGATRWYSLFGPLEKISTSERVAFGYGLGGSSVYLYDVVPSEAYFDLEYSSYEGKPNLKNLYGRLIAEGGLIGMLFMAMILVLSFLQIHKLIINTHDPNQKKSLAIMRLVMIG